MFTLWKLFLLTLVHGKYSAAGGSCPDIPFGIIPAGHDFHKLAKPAIIAHRGQPRLYQENTVDGVMSAVDAKADGFEVDIFLTKDEKLVVFHDENLMKMTGYDMKISECTYDEIAALNLTTKITKGGKTYTFDRPRKIPLLEDLLRKTRETSLFHYLEMKPEKSVTAEDVERATKTGELVADLVTSLGLTNQTFLVSFDYLKTYAAKQRVPTLTVGTLFQYEYFDMNSTEVERLKNQILVVFPALKSCLSSAPSDGEGFGRFLLETGILFKAAKSSFFDDYMGHYNNPVYSNNTFDMLKKNYGGNVSFGAYTIYSMSNTEQENMDKEAKLELLVKQMAERLITDDVARLRRKIGRGSNSHAATVCSHISWLLALPFAVLLGR